MNNYYDRLEQRDSEILTEFNNQVKFFTELKFTEKGTRIDATGIDIKGRKANIEVKQRTGRYGNFEAFRGRFKEIYLDTGKLDYFSNLMMKSGFTMDEQELFISIFDDGDTIVIHNLNKPQPVMWLPNQTVTNIGGQRRETEHKIGFLISEAIIYRKVNGKYTRIQ